MTILQYSANLKHNIPVIAIVQRISDILIMIVGFYLGCVLNDTSFSNAVMVIFMLSLLIFQTVGGVADLYRSWRGMKITDELFSLLRNWTISLAITWGVTFAFPLLHLSFQVIIHWYLAAAGLFIVSRMGIRVASGILRRYGYNTRNVCVAGNMPAGISLLHSFQQSPWLGFVVKGIYDDNVPTEANGINYAGSLEALVNDAREGKLDRIYIAMNMKDEAIISELVKQLTDTTCSVLLVPDIFTFNILQSRTEEINGVPVVPLVDTPFNGINGIFKRLEDIIVSLCVLTMISPVLLIIACAIKITSPGPVIFRQTRYGMDGKPITVWKFRSMTVMENADVVTQATKNDTRVTRIGKFLRRTSLDELPQFFNVLFGQMSVVGPRPHAVSHNEQYRFLIEGYMLRHKVKPGITGLAQINGWRGETDTLEKMQKRIEFDLEYIRIWSVWVDLHIIFLTVFKGFVHKSAY